MKAKGSIRQRGHTWTITLDTGDVDATGKRIRKYAKADTKADAEKLLRDMQHALDTGQLVTTKITVGEWLGTWLRVKVEPSDRKASTKAAYRTIVRAKLIPAFGKIGLAISQFSTLRAPMPVTITVDGLSPNSITTFQPSLERRTEGSRKAGPYQG